MSRRRWSSGCAVSVSGLAFRRGEEATAESVRLVPPDRILVETDAPYLSPPGAPRRRNEPAWVRVTARWVAERRGEDPDELGDAARREPRPDLRERRDVRARVIAIAQRRRRQRSVIDAMSGRPGSTSVNWPVFSPSGGPVCGSTQTPSACSV